MKYDPKTHHRHSIRLKDYDYSTNRAYFITICTQDRKNYFGSISNGIITLSKYGEIADDFISKISEIFPDTNIDCKIVMPNHIHFIVGVAYDATQNPTANDDKMTMQQKSKMIIPKVIQQYKSAVVRASKKLLSNDNIAKGLHTMQPLRNPIIWQRNYHEHVIRNEQDLHEIREYIVNNAAKWADDRYYG